MSEAKMTVKDPAEKLAHRRLRVLELAEALGNITQTCKRMKMDRTSFYEWKRRFQTQGIAGLKDLPPIHLTHPQTTPPEVVEKILEATLKHPRWGCMKISDWLKVEGSYVSGPTVQGILNKHKLGTKYERQLKLEEKHLQEGMKLTAEQIALIEKLNPCFKERHVESSKPGELLSQDTFYVGTLKGIGRVYLQAVVDTYGSYAFGYLHTGKIPEQAAAILHEDVLPQYKAWKLPVKAILTDNGREYCGTDHHPYEIYLALNDIEHRRTKVRRPRTNGFVERFNKTVLEEFFSTTFREKFYESVEALQEDLDQWLKHYNTERPHRGYRNMGKRPFETVSAFIKTARHEG